MIVDLYLIYSFLKRLTTPFDKWKAFDLGIIDASGNILKSRSNLTSSQEKAAFGLFDLMVLNLKKLLETLPGGKKRIASYAAALFLIREKSIMSEEFSEQKFFDFLSLVENKIDTNDTEKFIEDISNMVSSGDVEGTGFGMKGEPGVIRRMDSLNNKKKKKETI